MSERAAIRSAALTLLIGSLCAVLIGSVLSGCIARNYVYAKNPYSLPSGPEPQLDTAGVYIASIEVWSSTSPTGLDTLRAWYRFFSNGRVYQGSSHGSYPTESEVNTLYDAPYPYCSACVSRHYYRVDSNEVTMEIYLNRMNGFRYLTAKIYPDSLVVYKVRRSESSKRTEKMREVYIRTPYRLTNHNADW